MGDIYDEIRVVEQGENISSIEFCYSKEQISFLMQMIFSEDKHNMCSKVGDGKLVYQPETIKDFVDALSQTKINYKLADFKITFYTIIGNSSDNNKGYMSTVSTFDDLMMAFNNQHIKNIMNKVKFNKSAEKVHKEKIDEFNGNYPLTI